MKSFRVEKVSSQLRQVLSDAIANKLQDPRISPMTSITRIDVTRDFEQAHVYVSVLADQPDQNKTIAALKHARGHMQSIVAKQLTLRHCPQLIFHLDESLKKGQEVLQMIDESMSELEQDALRRAETAPAPPASDAGELE